MVSKQQAMRGPGDILAYHLVAHKYLNSNILSSERMNVKWGATRRIIPIILVCRSQNEKWWIK